VVAEPVEHEHGDGDEERRPGRVSEREGRPPHPQQPVTRNEAKPCADAAVLFLLRRRRPLRHEDRDEEERDEICRRVDHEHRGRTRQPDQQARERGPDEDRHAVCALKERVCLGDPLLVLADQLRDDHLLGGEVGGGQRAEGEGHGEQERERDARGPVQHRDDEHQRGPGGVAKHHRPTSAKRAEHTSTGEPEQREADDLGRDHERRVRRRTARHKHEPRQREPGHLGARGRDDLGDEQRQHRTVAQELAAAHGGPA
jgi:hypothetical protein